MQNFDPLAGRIDLTACGGEGGYATDGIAIPIRFFSPAGAWFRRLGFAGRAGARLGLWDRPLDYYVGLEEWLSGVGVAHAAETGIGFSEQAVRAKLNFGTKVVLTCWETIPFAYEEDPAIRRRRAFVRAHADLFLPTTQRAAAALTIEGVEPARIQVVMPGVDVRRFAPGERDPELSARFGLAGDEVVVLFVGRLILEKGVRELVVAFAAAMRQLPLDAARRCRLLIAGGGPQEAFVTDLIRSLVPPGQARVVGGMNYSEIHRLHQIADLFVLPSIATPYWEEQYGMVLVEAMACGKPVVSTTTGAIAEVVGDAGVVVPPLDVGRLADAIARLAGDRALREQLGRVARRRATAQFDANDVAERLSVVYSRLLGGAAGGPAAGEAGAVSAAANGEAASVG